MTSTQSLAGRVDAANRFAQALRNHTVMATTLANPPMGPIEAQLLTEAADAIEALTASTPLHPVLDREWQPIETAPKDGTKVLIYVPAVDDVPEGVFAGWWDAQFTYHYNPRRGEWHEGAWTDYGVKSFGYEEYQCYAPTHWMPIPTSPSPSAGETDNETLGAGGLRI